MGQQVIFFFFFYVRILCRERIYMKKLKIKKNLLKNSFQLNFKFSKSIEQFKSYIFFPSMYNKSSRMTRMYVG